MKPLTPHENQLRSLFGMLHQKPAKSGFPAPGTFGSVLSAIVTEAEKKHQSQVQLKGDVAVQFVTSAVEMWHRAVHSYVISALLSKASPLWASVSGYYSSHYTVRGIGHLLGLFQLHRKRRIVELVPGGTTYSAQILKKDASTREHKFYWRIVKQHPLFASDPFFVFNNELDPVSDGAHRNLANYADHINQFPNFDLLEMDQLENRLQHIASADLSSVPIPNAQKYPDLDSVQLIAYHRITRFRSFLDELLGGSNTYWTVHRNPSWCHQLLDFQVAELSLPSLPSV